MLTGLGVAASLHQVAMIHQDRGEYGEALEYYEKALTLLTQLQSPDAKIAMNNLKKLRDTWGHQEFDEEWRKKTGKAFNGEGKE